MPWRNAFRSIAAARHFVNFDRHDEVVFVQTLDFLGLQRNRGVAPAERDIGMMTLVLSQIADFVNEFQLFGKVLELVRSVDFMRAFGQAPARRLGHEIFRFRSGKRRNSAAARGAGLANQLVGHVGSSNFVALRA